MPFLTVPARHGRSVIEVPLAHDGARETLDLDAIESALAQALPPPRRTATVTPSRYLSEAGLLAAAVAAASAASQGRRIAVQFKDGVPA